MAETVFGAVVLRYSWAPAHEGSKKTAYWPGVGVMEFLRKRVMRIDPLL